MVFVYTLLSHLSTKREKRIKAGIKQQKKIRVDRKQNDNVPAKNGTFFSYFLILNDSPRHPAHA